jgi:hypothetical protein
MANGLLRLSFSSGQSCFFSSYRQNQRWSPVSFLRAAARFRRIAGAYVSLIMHTITKVTPEHIMTTQLVHLQPRYWYTKPPMRGPITGCGRVSKVLHTEGVGSLETYSVHWAQTPDREGQGTVLFLHNVVYCPWCIADHAGSEECSEEAGDQNRLQILR